ncbi:GNAT family N-acetyltransferase [Clostridium sardiniense]|uniref:GNAT family N-acetyltransferase n=1 Tax=Clostridium sardiniense TaxID=29369 RepID=UPI003D3441AA
MDEVIYRDVTKEDYKRIKELIGEAFHINEFIKDENFLDSLLNCYLQECIIDSSFSKVAEKNNKVVGIILASSEKDKNRLKKMHNTLSFIYSIFKIFIANKENKKALKEFSKIRETYDEIIKGKEDDFEGCIELFIVSKESRGFGVGKTLMNYLYNYMKSIDVKSMYLYTDSICNYGFYDSQNFKRLNEKKIYLDYSQEELNIFLYGYKF